ncbi:hypothetical protein AUEXF2481DRAFT_3372 [Aureobasidium subglaciale EXF-2481]|uniref:Pullulan synthetase n=1 Tax=Aureobasidium subglaciale (strain EXF-2481) TaxID=1043005 RepID=A0A074YTW5_AURSE|nr:uncharacterized protein AUEXF2481DRAFT_3372 [Aureobasidium subglaciale EXF-2481]KAI5199039.1 hypothetical protein E4T38_07225 [Aureobasidium subglaciale]KAI5217805.1 hypothetical protein E4T40_07236 [Aureobasidium subglaciale]KAI5220678.1 hypothetical protein E4T41_07390 [Aureobasidium subglaciale]KAI5258382.1 hypothetical protein E4T46_07367 [Aureobasidium subglaciale]KEQ97572.1 hypothetical protein AUEXF2481DRAFT_3372 [Aureobasidium subglaciale EXF-2481]
MHFSILALAASVAALATASPTRRVAGKVPVINSTQPFYLLTTDSETYSDNATLLSNVSLTTLFSPYYQSNYLLRLIAPGYGSVPQFTLGDGILHTPTKGPHGIGDFIYNSSEVHTGSELQFRAEQAGPGDLGLKNGYLLGVNGSSDGWTIEWKGTKEGCTQTYIQAALNVPY